MLFVALSNTLPFYILVQKWPFALDPKYLHYVEHSFLRVPFIVAGCRPIIMFTAWYNGICGKIFHVACNGAVIEANYA